MVPGNESKLKSKVYVAVEKSEGAYGDVKEKWKRQLN
jgi:hypothetical protein